MPTSNPSLSYGSRWLIAAVPEHPTKEEFNRTCFPVSPSVTSRPHTTQTPLNLTPPGSDSTVGEITVDRERSTLFTDRAILIVAPGSHHFFSPDLTPPPFYACNKRIVNPLPHPASPQPLLFSLLFPPTEDYHLFPNLRQRRSQGTQPGRARSEVCRHPGCWALTTLAFDGRFPHPRSVLHTPHTHSTGSWPFTDDLSEIPSTSRDAVHTLPCVTRLGSWLPRMSAMREGSDSLVW